MARKFQPGRMAHGGMSSLIIVVGTPGVGKTTLARLLAQEADLVTGLESHADRPFQALFREDPRHALANQVDYFLLRAEQERRIREGSQSGILDGGLEMDLHVFSRLFLQKGWLTGPEFKLLERLHQTLRLRLPPPDLILWMEAGTETVSGRFQRRERTLEITTPSDLETTTRLLADWLRQVPPERLLRVDANPDDPGYQAILPGLVQEIRRRVCTNA